MEGINLWSTRLLILALMAMVVLAKPGWMTNRDGSSSCQCSDLTVYDGNSGKNIGGCLTTHNGRYWCYVSANSPCLDKRESSRTKGLFFSYAGCKSDGPQFEPAASIYYPDY